MRNIHCLGAKEHNYFSCKAGWTLLSTATRTKQTSREAVSSPRSLRLQKLEGTQQKKQKNTSQSQLLGMDNLG